jgi:hypothetical protein
MIFSSCREEELMPPETPELVSPENNATGQPFSISFSWNKATGAVEYDFQLSPTNDFSSAIAFAEDLESTSFDASNLEPSKTYYWRVRAKNSAGRSPWSQIFQFATSTLSVPTLITPIANAPATIDAVEFDWTNVESADGYDFQVSTENTFQNQVVERNGLSVSSSTLTGLMFATDYFWRVRATRLGAKSGWSEVRKLTTNPLGIPQLLTPSDNAQLSEYSATLSWEPVTYATSYIIQVSYQADFSTLIVNSTEAGTLSHAVEHLRSNTSYYWRVKSLTDKCFSEWSSVRSFRSPAVPTNGLVAWFPFNSSANDESGNGNHGTLVGGVTTTSDRRGENNRALLFDGVSGYVDIPSLNDFQYKPVSYSAWVVVDSYFSTAPGIKFRSIVGRQETFNTQCGMLGFYADQSVAGGAYDNTFLYWMGGASTPDVPNSNVIPTLNEWTHVVFTQQSDGSFSFYINGELTKSGVLNNVQNADISFRIGSGIGANSFFWNNKIDDVRIYSRAITSAEVKALYLE